MRRVAVMCRCLPDKFRQESEAPSLSHRKGWDWVLALCCTVLFTATCSAPAIAQQFDAPFDAICMSRNAGYILQTYLSTPSFPAEEVNKKWNEGYRITSVAQGDGLWHVVMSNPSGLNGQGFIIADTVPLDRIEEMWDNGFAITNMCFGNGQWTFIYSQIAGSLTKQAIFSSRDYPYQFMDTMMRKGYRVMGVAKGNDRWVAVMQTVGMFQYQQSIYKSDNNLDTAEVRSKMRQGFRLSYLHHSDRVWTAVLNGASRYSDQILLTGDSASKESIKRLWDQGYRITDIAAGQTFIVVDMVEKKQQDKDIYSESVNLVEPLTPANVEAFRGYVHRKAPSDVAYFAAQKFAAALIKEKKYAAAADTLRQFLPFFPDSAGRPSKLARTIELLLTPEENLPVTNLGPSINGAVDEWDPCPSADGRFLYFSTNGKPGGEGGQDVFYAEAILEDSTERKGVTTSRGNSSRKQKPVSKAYNGWKPAQSIGRAINTRSEETMDNVSTDGNTLYLSGAFRGSFGQFDIFTAEKTASGWSRPIQIPRPVNSQYHEEAGCLSADGQFLVFTSDRPGGIGPYVPKTGYIYAGQGWGNSDIYVCAKTPNGWGEPVNLGKTINTPFAESAVFLHPDGKTMYFCSNGHYGLGGLDIFKTTRLSDSSWTEWSEPVNIGKIVNTAEDDWGYKVTVQGDRAYFAARNREGGYGGWDIYTMPLPKNLRPDNVITIRGKVVDARGLPLGATISWEELPSGRTVGTLKSDPETGMYFIALPKKKLYGYYAEKQGYYSVSKNADLRNPGKKTEFRYDITLVKAQDLAAMSAVPINNIFFDYDSFELQSESFPELQRLAAFLKENPAMKIEIAGHTDDQGTDAYNLTLSQRRAESVRDYLVKNGCNAGSISARGYGKTKPLATGTTDEARAQNRRVEFRALEKKK